jgi:thioredoxin reductase (NADPH)
MIDSRYETAFPTLTEEQMQTIESHAEVVTLQDGDYLWRAGHAEISFFIIKDGRVEVLDDSSGKAVHVAFHEPGAFTGDVDLLSGRPSVVSAVARGTVEVIKLSVDCLRKIVREWPALSDIILKAFIMRRVLLLEQGITGIRVIGSRFSAETQAIREFCARNRVPYTWLDLERDPSVQALLKTFDIRENETPVVLMSDGVILKNPSVAHLAELVGVRRVIEHTIYDLVVVGAGPAGLAASVYGASEGLRTLLLDRVAPGGQAGTSSKIENYMGFPTGLSGQDLAERGLVQAEKFGATLSVPTEVTKLECGNGDHVIEIDGGEEIHARAVILATGAQYRKLDVPGYDKLEMSGIYYAATGMEAQLCRTGDVVIVGAGNSAGQAAMYLSDFAHKVYMVVRGKSLDASMSSYLSRRIETIHNIQVFTESVIAAVHGEQAIEGVEVRDCRTDNIQRLSAVGLFVFIGAIPQTEWASEQVRLDAKGFVLTGAAVAKDESWPLPRPPLFLETSCPGIFAAGDVRSGSIKRVASAVGEGSMAVAFVHEYLQGAHA